MDGIVCPICQERAIYDYGYGKGIIKIDDLLTNVQTQPLLHANCFPAGTEVSGIIPKTATRRHYQGNMIIIETASGLKLTVTPKHPILTNNVGSVLIEL
jgi:intein/homing endonuclease